MNVTIWLLIAAIFGILVLAILARLAHKMPKRGLNKGYFYSRWTELLEHLKSHQGMALAVIDADKLVDEALRKRNFRGKTMGERLVAAQKVLSQNDAVWYGHKLRNRLVHEPSARLKKQEVHQALSGFRQALKDLGAL